MQLACVECAGAFLVVASAMGQARAPAWQHNLEATPEAWVQLRGERVRVRAELLSDAEKQACWEEIRR